VNVNSIYDVLKYTERPVLALETHTNNTAFLSIDYYDNLGALESEPVVVLPSNADMVFSTGPVLGKHYHKLLLNETSLVSSIPEPFSGSGGSNNIATFSIDYKGASQNLRDKFWDDSPYVLKVGGRVFYQEEGQTTLDYSDYKVISTGTFTSFSLDDNLELSCDALPAELYNPFPVNTHDGGLSDGATKDYIFGDVRGHSPKPVQPGIFDFHDGKISPNRDTPIDFCPFVAFEDQEIYGDLDVTGATTGLVYDSTDLNLVTESNQKLVSTVPVNIQISTFRKNTTLQANKDSSGVFRVLAEDDAKTDIAAVARDFNFRKQSDKRAVSSGRVGCEITTTGGAVLYNAGGDVDGYSNYWVKLNGRDNDTGRVKIKLDRKIKGATLVVRSLNQDPGAVATIDNWSKDPDSITPDYGLTVNSEVVLSNVFSDTIEFDYTGNGLFDLGDGTLTAIWIKELEAYTPQVMGLCISSDVPLAGLTLEVLSSSGESITSFSKAPDIPLSLFDSETGATRRLVWTEVGADKLNMNWFSVGEEVIFNLSQLVVSSGTFGTFLEEGIIRMIPAASSSTGFSTRMLIKDSPSDTTAYRNCSFRARVVGLTQVDVSWGYTQGVPELTTKVTDSFEEYTFVAGDSVSDGYLGGASASGGLHFFTTRGLTPYEVHVTDYREWVADIPANNSFIGTENKVLDPQSDEPKFIQGFKVPSIEQYPALPRSLSLYDDQGNLKVSEKYGETVFGSFHGQRELQFDSDILVDNTITKVWTDPQGRIYIHGPSITQVEGSSVTELVRLSSEGEYDPTFKPDVLTTNPSDVGMYGLNGIGQPGPVTLDDMVFVGEDIYISGNFGSQDLSTRSSLIKLDEFGRVDTSFDVFYRLAAVAGSDLSITRDGDKFLITGDFTSLLGKDTDGVLRLNSDFSVDNTFTADFNNLADVLKIIPFGDKYYVCGSFSEQGQIDGWVIYRLNNDGSIDPSFDAGTASDGDTAKDMLLLEGNRILIVGDWLTLGGIQNSGHAALLDSSGNVLLSDPNVSRNAAGAPISDDFNGGFNKVWETDNGYVVQGSFTEAGTRQLPGLAGLDASLKLMPSFGEAITGATEVQDAAYQIGDRLIIVGSFTDLNGVPRNRIARLNADGTIKITPVGDVMKLMVDAAAGEGFVLPDYPRTMRIGKAFTEQRPVISWCDTLCSETDFIRIMDLDTQKLAFRSRYNGNPSSAEFEISDALIIKDSIVRERTLARQSRYEIEYFDENSDKLRDLDSVSSLIIRESKLEPKTIFSSVVEKSDAEYLAGRILRDGSSASEWSFSLEGDHHRLDPGMVGYVFSPDLPQRFICELTTVTRNLETRNMDIVAVFYNNYRSAV